MERGSRALLAAVLGALVTVSSFLARQELRASSGTVEPRSTVVVQVVDPAGAVIPNARITIQNGGGYVARGNTNASGVFSLQDIPVGDYAVLVESRGFAAQSSTISVREHIIATVVAQLELGPAMIGGDPIGATVMKVEPVTSNTTSEVLSYPGLGHLPLGGGPTDLQQASQDHPWEAITIDFTILDPSGVAIPRAVVSVSDGKKKLSKGRTDAHGVLRISGLPSGVHSYTVKCEGFPKLTGEISLSPGQHAEITVKLKFRNPQPVTSVD